VVKDSGDSTLGEESAKIWYLQEKGLKYSFLGFCRKEIWPSHVTRKSEEWLGAQPPLTIESFFGSLKNLVVFSQISRTS
jgi:hypothetical protein